MMKIRSVYCGSIPMPLIMHGKQPSSPAACLGDVNARRPFPTEFDGIAEQVLEQLHQLSLIASSPSGNGS